VYGALNALPRRETPTRFEYDSDAWHRLPVERRPAGFHPLYGVSEEFSIDGGQRSIYGLSKLIADAACQEYVHAYDLPIVVNRIGVISGVGQFGDTDQGWVVWWAIAHWFQPPLTYLGWQGKQVRDVLFVEDMLSLLDRQLTQLTSFRGEFSTSGAARPMPPPFAKRRTACRKSPRAQRPSPFQIRRGGVTSSFIGPTTAKLPKHSAGSPRPICVPALRASFPGFAKTSQNFDPGTLLELSRHESPQLLGNQGSE
jgi:NAD dependent epimerase/dehydratase family